MEVRDSGSFMRGREGWEVKECRGRMVRRSDGRLGGSRLWFG
ncbi:unnamed protein product [Chondrus crispus]|uniref:Uncharacterized protein n=1 Tax=Chondrus crispus TaxID=2769 RepID=R7QKL2_CHOCR|nr:unnamed protein product [Chondrus crispus]CDF37996.1 unnamed protein product [Chondrus crispus]|eukprot:XP_005717865.1 unnamed protein product [Chondrus crispus]